MLDLTETHDLISDFQKERQFKADKMYASEITHTQSGKEVYLIITQSDLNSFISLLKIFNEDATKGDGIYSRYFTAYDTNGRYSVKVWALEVLQPLRQCRPSRMEPCTYLAGLRMVVNITASQA